MGSITREQAIIAAERSTAFLETCSTLDHSLTTQGALTDDDFRELENALNLVQVIPWSSETDARGCTEFLMCTRLVMDCREAAERVTQAGWDQVCERLIALPEAAQ